MKPDGGPDGIADQLIFMHDDVAPQNRRNRPTGNFHAVVGRPTAFADNPVVVTTRNFLYDRFRVQSGDDTFQLQFGDVTQSFGKAFQLVV